jgi:Fic-DOC domain mobile mystery protein B
VVEAVALNFDYQPGQTPLDADEAAQLIPRHIATQNALDEWEQANILRAVQWARRQKAPTVLTEDFCRELHRRMFDRTWRWAGQFRQSDKNIGCAWPQVATRLRQLLDNTRYQMDENVFALDEAAARFHHQLVLVHPFPNGNGRHSRLMTDCLMRQNATPLFSWGSAQNLADAGAIRQRYIAALRAADAGDIAPLVAFVRS